MRRGGALAALQQCPAFQEGCPFKSAETVDDMRKVFEKLPPSHTHHGSPQHDSLLHMMHNVHEASLQVKESLGQGCPVFAEDCPFKGTACSNGTPLLDAMEYRSWTMVTLRQHTGRDDPSTADSTPPPLHRVSVAKMLKEGTREAHRKAESVHFVREFIRGRVGHDAYKHMLADLYFLYRTLEECLAECGAHPVLAPVYFPEELGRTAALEQDLAYHWGADWRSQAKPSTITQAYMSRLQLACREEPELLVPHAYTRYLGDLSGGQVLRRAATKAMQLPASGDGARFYQFDRIADMKAFKRMYRERLDTLPVASDTADRMVAEANFAFELNTHLFYELDVLAGFIQANDVPPLVPKPLPSAGVHVPPPPLASATSPDSAAVAAAAAAGCPFASLAKAGVPRPSGHPTTITKAASSTKATSGCPLHAFSVMDLAIVLALVGLVLVFSPPWMFSGEAISSSKAT